MKELPLITRPKRSPEFAERFNDACDRYHDCRPLHQGRLTWIRSRLKEEGLHVSLESVRKWLSGEGRPRQEKCEKLATILDVDGAWLYMGRDDSGVRGKVQPEHMNHEITDNRRDLAVIPITVRPNVVIQVSGLPLDLTNREAQRIANIIIAHASVD